MLPSLFFVSAGDLTRTGEKREGTILSVGFIQAPSTIVIRFLAHELEFLLVKLVDKFAWAKKSNCKQ